MCRQQESLADTETSAAQLCDTTAAAAIPLHSSSGTPWNRLISSVRSLHSRRSLQTPSEGRALGTGSRQSKGSWRAEAVGGPATRRSPSAAHLLFLRGITWRFEKKRKGVRPSLRTVYYRYSNNASKQQRYTPLCDVIRRAARCARWAKGQWSKERRNRSAASPPAALLVGIDSRR